MAGLLKTSFPLEVKGTTLSLIHIFEMKNDLSKKLQEFASYNDNLEEVFENREQIEISRYYEKLPKPPLIAAQEYEEGKVYFRNPAKEKEKLQ